MDEVCDQQHAQQPQHLSHQSERQVRPDLPAAELRFLDPVSVWAAADSTRSYGITLRFADFTVSPYCDKYGPTDGEYGRAKKQAIAPSSISNCAFPERRCTRLDLRS